MGNFRQRTRQLKYFLLLAVIVLVYYGASRSSVVQHYFSNPQSLRNLVLSFGFIGPLAIVLLQAFQTTISIIPSQLTTIVAGFVFGPVLGLVYSLIGAIIGSAAIFLLSKNYGKTLALKFFEKKEMVHFSLFFRQNRLWALFLARVSPVFPNDIVSFTAGLMGIGFWSFCLVSTAGFLIQMVILVFFGAGLTGDGGGYYLFLFGLLVVVLLIILIFRNKIKEIIIKDFHELEKKEKIIEKEFKYLIKQS